MQAGEETAAIEKAKAILSEGVKVFLQKSSKVKALDTETGEGIWDAPVANAGFQSLFRLRGMIWYWSMVHASPPLTRSRARFDGKLPALTRRIQI